jgi:pimeloyl-ACP methyl ester carboxylesterase
MTTIPRIGNKCTNCQFGRTTLPDGGRADADWVHGNADGIDVMVVEVEGAPHGRAWTHPAEVNQAILAFSEN